jgi:hypothetical protein
MKVYNVALTAPNGNRVSGPVLAENRDAAVDEFLARHDEPNEAAAIRHGLKIEASEADDPDGSYAALLRETCGPPPVRRRR